MAILFYPAATMETAQAATEEALYANLPETRTDKSTVAGYPNDNTTSPNDKIAKVSGSGQKIGPSITLKVMAGDHFNIKVSSWYQTNGATPQSPVSSLTDIVAGLINGLSGAANGAHGNVTAAGLQSSGVITPDATDFLNNQPDPGTKPKAYLNWILLDDQFNYVQSGSGAEQVPDESEFGTAPNNHVYQHVETNLPVTKNGYLYVYISNETPNIDVFFDNLQVTHIHGQILEETHYYPFGLTMAGISDKAAEELQNKYGITGKEKQSQEFSDGSGLETYDFGARMQDPQIGRWNQIDPIVANYCWISPYNYCNNNPVKYYDPNGMEFRDTVINGQKQRIDIGTLADISITGKSKSSLADRGLAWANYDQGEADQTSAERNQYYANRRDGFTKEQMFKDPAWAQLGGRKLDNFERGWQSELSYRNSQLIIVGILGAPILGTVAPEILTAIQGQAVLANIAIREAGIYTDAAINLMAGDARSIALRGLLRVLPLSYSTAKMFINLSNKPIEISAKDIYETLKFVLEQQGYKGLPSSSDLFPEVKLPTK